MLKSLSLFSGIGGFDLAAQRIGGFTTTQFVEINPDAQTVLKHHFKGVPIHDDIRTYQPRFNEFNLVYGGFPCTNTSCAGNRDGIEGEYSSLWWEHLRVLSEVQPSFSIIEQPPGVIDRGLRTILGGLRMAGYQSEVEIVSAAELGAGHRRSRLFIVSYPDSWGKDGELAPTWSSQIRAMVQAERNDSQWLQVKRSSDGSNYGFSSALVEPCLIVPANRPGRLKARILAGRSVTPDQAATALRRVKFLNEFYGGN